MSGLLRICAGQPDLAIEHVETALRVESPRAHGSAPIRDGVAYFFKHRFDEAAAKLLLAIQDDPGFPAIIPLFSPRAMRIWDGSTKRERLSLGCAPLRPVVVPSDLPGATPQHRELFLSGLRLAAGEET